MKPFADLLNWVVRLVFRLICRLDIAELKKVPWQGPFILVGNHVNFLEIPVLRASLHPRDIVGLTKVETFNNPIIGFLFQTWGSIAIERGAVDRTALQACANVLAAGKILAVAPEGTRSGDGKLLPGKPGIALLAVRSGVPLVPMTIWGAEHVWDNLKHFRRTPFHVRIGQPFVIDTHGENLSRELRQRIADEIMFKIAEPLPEQYHGAYPHPERVEYHYLRNIHLIEESSLHLSGEPAHAL